MGHTKRPEEQEKPMKPYDRMPVFRSRNYPFFALLAGVRGEGPEPVGLPPDPSQLTEMCVTQLGADGHSHSWLPYREFCERYTLTTAEIFTNGGNMEALSGIDDFEDQFGPDERDGYAGLRVVFWFDN